MKDLLAAIAAIEDPIERFKVATETGELARTVLQAGARQIRQGVIKGYRDQGMTHGEIAKLVGLDRNRVQQIGEGRTGGTKTKAKKVDADA